MDLDDVMTGINLLVQQMDSEPDDLHEIHFKLREMLNELKATGMPLPADLVALDEQLDVAERGGAES
jgi:hypothetical protein